ncbi:L,D-transpeptidase family protein [Aneurinibacillus sp. BA2021]|nr:L,D-transpeptidase family protein [Aneurinibacillus sp. BA2021]
MQEGEPALRQWHEKVNEWSIQAGWDDAIRQVIVAATPDWKSRQAYLEALEKVNGVWVPVLDPLPAVVGRHGYVRPEAKKEGDASSPAGMYALGTAFGTAPKPAGVRMPYRVATRRDYWVDDASSPDYNTWVHYEGNPRKRWRSFERLAIPLYKYALVIRYNDEPVIPGKGSAIFMHIWRGPASYTAGCVALSESNLLALLRWLDPDKSPVIVQGPAAFLSSFAP